MYRLLVLEDENRIRQGICRLIDFETLGIAPPLEARDGEEGLALLKSQRVDVVLADINMPKMDGLEFARQAKALNPALRIALMTGYDSLDYAISAVKIGVDDYVLKPVSKEDVRQLLVRLLERRRAEEQNQRVRTAVERLAPAALEGEDRLKRQMEDILREHLGDAQFSLGRLAELTGYSLSYLSSQFKRRFGENFRDYLLNLRLEKAKILLLSTEMHNYEIAAAVGIDDPNYLSVCFKRKYRMTTTEYRGGAHGKEA